MLHIAQGCLMWKQMKHQDLLMIKQNGCCSMIFSKHYAKEDFAQPDIDLFASRLNRQVECYCVWQPDPGAVYIDPFMYDWSRENCVYPFHHSV